MGQKLWGITAGAENMPNWLSDKEKKNVFADKRGWVLRHASGIEETLVSISGLGTRLGSASPSYVYFDDAPYYTGQTNRAVYVEFNEKISHTSGTPTIVLTGGSSVSGAAIVHGGTAYTEATVEVIGDGFGAAVSVTLLDGAIHTVTVDNAGSGYRTISLKVVGNGEGAELSVTLGAPVQVTATYDSIVGTENNTLKFHFTAPNDRGDWLDVLPQTIGSASGIKDTAANTSVDAVIVADAKPKHLKEIIWD